MSRLMCLKTLQVSDRDYNFEPWSISSRFASIGSRLAFFFHQLKGWIMGERLALHIPSLAHLMRPGKQ